MARAQFGSSRAPFKTARDSGFVFHAPSFRMAYAALDQAFLTNHFPLVLEGPRGVGKATSVLFWLRAQPEGTVTAAAIDAETFEVGESGVAGAVLDALGFAPADDADPRDALRDAIEDCAFEDRPVIVTVLDADTLPREDLQDLLLLAEPAAQGGAGLPLVLTSSTDLGRPHLETVRLPRLTPAVALRFFRAVIEASRIEKLDIAPEAAERLCAEADGTMALAGPLFDDAAETALRDGTHTIDERHVGLPPRQDEPRIDDLTPSAIEEAIMALGREVDAAAVPVVSSEASLPPRSRANFPRIETEGRFAFGDEPANDPSAGLDPALIDDLVALRRSIEALKESIETIRGETSALGEALRARHRRIEDAAEHVAETTRDAIRFGGSGGAKS